MVDTTQSIKQKNINELKTVLKNLVQQFDISNDGAHIALETFGDKSVIHNLFDEPKFFEKKLSYKSDRRKNRQTDKTYASRFGIGEGRLRTIHQGKWRQTWRTKCYGFVHRRKVSPKGDGEKKVQGTFEKY